MRSPASTPAAERARRYRARQRGDDVPRRKPGPVPASPAALRSQAGALARENAILRQKLEAAGTVPAMVSRGRQGSARGLAVQLLGQLEHLDPSKDAPDFRETLRDLTAAIDERHDHWPET